MGDKILSNIEFKKIAEDILFLIASDARLKLLFQLIKEPRTTSQLSKLVSLNYVTLITNLTKLEEKNYVYKESGKYYIKNAGKMKITNFIRLFNSFTTIEKCEDIFYKHNLDEFSEKDILNIKDLENSEIQTTDLENLYNLENIKEDILNNADFLNFVMPLFNPLYLQVINTLLENNVNIHLILPQEAFDVLSLGIDNDKLKEKLHTGQLKVNTRNDIKTELIATDKSLCLTLFNDEGFLDQNRLLVSHDFKAVDWGLNAFNNMLKQNEMKITW